MSLPDLVNWWVQCSSMVDELSPCCACSSYLPTPYPVDGDTEMHDTLMSCCRTREHPRWLRHRTTSSDISDDEL